MIARGRPIGTEFVGRKRGRYSAVVSGLGFAGSLSDVSTAPGVHDVVRGRRDTVSFDGGVSRPLTIEMAQQAHGASGTAWSATLRTQTEHGRAESAGLNRAGTLTLSHGGGPTTVSFTLSSARPGTGTATFASGPMLIGAGDRVTVRPGAGLHAVGVTIRDRRGQTRAMVLGNHAPALATLRLSAPRRVGSRVLLRATVAGLRTRTVMGVVLRLLHGRRLILRRVTSVKQVRNGRRTFTFHLPSGLRGSYTLLANASLVASPAGPTTTLGNVNAGSRARIRMK
jgi:hypothetical protein